MGDIWDVLKVFGGGIGALVMWLVGSKVIENLSTKLIERRFQKQDASQQLHETNQGKKIDFDQFTYQVFVEEFKAVKQELKEQRAELKSVTEKLNSQMVDNTAYKIENEHLRDKEKEQGVEIKRLTESNRKLTESDREKDLKIQNLETELGKAQTQIEILGQKIDSLTKK